MVHMHQIQKQIHHAQHAQHDYENGSSGKIPKRFITRKVSIMGNHLRV